MEIFTFQNAYELPGYTQCSETVLICQNDPVLLTSFVLWRRHGSWAITRNKLKGGYMQVCDQTAFAGRSSSLVISDGPSPTRMGRDLEDLEERLVLQENRTFRAMLLAILLAALALALAASLIVRL